MTKLMEKALEAVRQLPPERQDEIALAILNLAGDPDAEEIDPADLPDVLEGLAQASAVSLRPTPRLKQRSAASTDEASVHAAGGRKYPRNR